MAFADVYWPMLAKGFETRAKYGDAFKLEGGDGVHPGWAGHVMMASAYLKALGLDGDGAGKFEDGIGWTDQPVGGEDAGPGGVGGIADGFVPGQPCEEIGAVGGGEGAVVFPVARFAGGGRRGLRPCRSSSATPRIPARRRRGADSTAAAARLP